MKRDLCTCEAVPAIPPIWGTCPCFRAATLLWRQTGPRLESLESELSAACVMQAPVFKRVRDLWISRADTRASVSSPRAPCESGHEQREDGAPARRQRIRPLVRFPDAGAGDPAAGRLPSCSAQKAQRRHRARLLSSICCTADTDSTRREPDVRLLTRECSLLSAWARGNQLLGIDLHLVPWCCHGRSCQQAKQMAVMWKIQRGGVVTHNTSCTQSAHRRT